MNMILQADPFQPNRMDLRWVDEVMEDTLMKLMHRIENLRGVEGCVMLRYSATICLATHVVSRRDFADMLRAELVQAYPAVELTVL
jgi:hypothetical protein